MQLTHIIEHRFHRTADGAVWTDTSYEYAFWNRYLKMFDSVAIVSRVAEAPGAPHANWQRVDGPGVRLIPVPYYLGPLQYFSRAREVRAAVLGAIHKPSAVVLRIPSTLGDLAAARLWRDGRPYAVHVVGDPHAAFAPGATRHPLRGVFRWWFARSQARQCANATAALYVTSALRRAYPPGMAERVLDCSDVNLEDADFRAEARNHLAKSHTNLVTVATLSQVYKGIDVLLNAVALCRVAGLSLDLTIVGSGKYQSMYVAQAHALQLSENVRFLGALPAGAAVQRELERADLFVLPSRTEGMPRALLEAMALALPCVATSVGGIPEVLASEDLVSAGDASGLAVRLREVLETPGRMNRMSERNLATARRYRTSELHPQWDGFFGDLLERTQHHFQPAHSVLRRADD